MGGRWFRVQRRGGYWSNKAQLTLIAQRNCCPLFVANEFIGLRLSRRCA